MSHKIYTTTEAVTTYNNIDLTGCVITVIVTGISPLEGSFGAITLQYQVWKDLTDKAAEVRPFQLFNSGGTIMMFNDYEVTEAQAAAISLSGDSLGIASILKAELGLTNDLTITED